MTTVAYVCADPGVPVHGTKGASVHVQEIVRAWRRRGATVRLYCTRVGTDLPADLADVAVVHEPVDDPRPHAAGRPTGSRARAAKRERHQAQAGRRLAQRVLADGADVVYERYSLFSTALADVAAAGVPGVLEVNAPLIDEQRTHRHLVDVAGAEAALRAQVAAAARVAAVSAPIAAWVRRHTGRPGDDQRILVCPNGVDPQRILPSAPDPDGPPVVLFVGTLKPWHGVETLLSAASSARRPWRVRVVGDGPLGEVLRRQAAALGIDADFRGAVAPSDIPDHLAGASVAVAPYPADTSGEPQYFSPLKVYEYAAAGLPVVASRVGQLPEVVEHGVTGLLVPPADPAALAEAVDSLLADPARARGMGRAARELMIRDHSWDGVLDRIVAGAPLGPRVGAGVDPAGMAPGRTPRQIA